MATFFLGKNRMQFGLCCEPVVGFEGEIRRKLFVGVSHRLWYTSSLLILFTLCRNGLLLLILVATCVAT